MYFTAFKNYEKNILAMWSLTTRPSSGPWKTMFMSLLKSSVLSTSSMGSFISIVILCNTVHAIMILHTLSGCILISACKQLKRFFHHLKHLWIPHLVLVCALLNFSWESRLGLRYGVIRKLLHAYPLSPRMIPPSTHLRVCSRWLKMFEQLMIWLSWTLHGHLATTFVNLPTNIIQD